MIFSYKIFLAISIFSIGFAAAASQSRVVVGWGHNLYGQIDQSTNRTAPKSAVEIDFRNVLDGKTIQDMVVGWNHIVILTTSGEVFTWGLGQFGVLGQGTEADSPVPVKPIGASVAKIAAGKHFTLALTTGGQLFGWGYNDNGQIASPKGNHMYSAVPVDSQKIGSLTIADVSIHPVGFHTVVRTTTGELFSWGLNNNGQLGDGSTTDRAMPQQIYIGVPPEAAAQVSAGGQHTMALSVANKLYIWGSNYYSELGTGSPMYGPDITAPTLVNMTGELAGKTIKSIYCGASSQYVFDSEGAIYGWGSGTMFPVTTETVTYPMRISSLDRFIVTKLFTSYSGSYILSNSTDLLTWSGETYDSGLGVALIQPTRHFTQNPSCPVVTVGQMQNAVAILTNCSTIFVWGDDLPIFGAQSARILPHRAPVPSNFYEGTTRLAANAQGRASAVLNDTSIFLWGYFEYLDQISPPSPNISMLTLLGQEIQEISWGTTSFLFLNRSNQILTSGSDLMGQMGDPGRQDRQSPMSVLVNDSLVIVGSKASNYSNFVWMESGELYVWGLNQLLVLGVGNVWGPEVPTLVSFSTAYPAGFFVVDVALGATFCVALSWNGQLASWGSKYHGFLPGDVYFPQALILPVGPHFVTKISAGLMHAIVLTQTGKLFVWGDNTYGQLGNGIAGVRDTPVELVRTSTILENIIIAEIVCGPKRTFVLDTQGHLFGWGTNQYGEISSLPDLIIATPVNMTADILAGFTVLNISAGAYHNLAVVLELVSVVAPIASPIDSPAPVPADAPASMLPPEEAPTADGPIAPPQLTPLSAPTEAPVAPPDDSTTSLYTNVGAIVGSIVGVAAAAAAAALAIFLMRRRKRNHKSSATPSKEFVGSGGSSSAPDAVYSSDKLANSNESTNAEPLESQSADQTKPPDSVTTNAATTSRSGSSQPGQSASEPPAGTAPVGAPVGKQAIEFKPEWMIDYTDIHFQKQIGSGSFGTVFMGTYEGEDCAIKQASFSVKPEALEDFKREAALILSIKPHPAIVQVLGIAQDKDNIYVVMELCDKGSLDKLLTATKIDNESKLRLLASAAAGIAHLHKSQVIHRDIAARNILVASPLRAKVAEYPYSSDLFFGMSRIVGKFENKGITASDVGPIRWMSPESIAKKEYSPASDVWMFAILCIEVWTEKPPHHDMDNFEVGMKIRNEGFHPDLPDDMPQWLKDTCLQCWSIDPGFRPTMSEIVNRFKFHTSKAKN